MQLPHAYNTPTIHHTTPTIHPEFTYTATAIHIQQTHNTLAFLSTTGQLVFLDEIVTACPVALLQAFTQKHGHHRPISVGTMMQVRNAGTRKERTGYVLPTTIHPFVAIIFRRWKIKFTLSFENI